MTEEFRRIGCDFIRFPAVDGASLPPEEIAAFRRERPTSGGGPWRPEHIGVFLSHFAIWEMVAGGIDVAAAIFEDDVHLASDLRPLLKADRWIPRDADIVRLEGMGNMKLARGARIRECKERRLHRAISGTWGAAGYVITKSAAARLIKVPRRQHMFVDELLFVPEGSPIAATLRRYQVVPSVCIQDQIKCEGSIGLSSLIHPEKTMSLPRPLKRKSFSWLRSQVRMTVRFEP